MKVLTAFDSAPHQYFDVIYKGLVSKGLEITDLNYSSIHNAESENGKIILRNQEGESIAQEGSDGMVHFPTPINGLNKCHKWLCTTARNYMYNPNAHESLDDFDAILIGAASTIDYKQKSFKELLDKVDHRFRLLDGGDDWYIRTGNDKFNIYFKRELMHSHVPNLKEFVARRFGDRRGSNSKEIISFWKREVIGQMLATDRKKTLLNVMGKLYNNDKRFHPLNLSVGKHDLASRIREKKFDIFFVTSSGSASRRYFAEKVLEFSKKHNLKAYVKVTGSFYGGLPWNEYVEIMRSSKLAVSLPGNGFDTIRYWEIPYYGTALVSQRLPLVIENDFVDMDSAIFFSDFIEFKQKVLEVLRKGLWDDISKKGTNIFNKFHTEEERANRILNTF